MGKGIVIADFGSLSDANVKKLENEGWIVVEKAAGRTVDILVYPSIEEKKESI